MHTLQSAKELLYSIPIDVHFAGFRSNTLELAKSGWDLSMRQEMSMRSPYTEMQLAMRQGNRETGLYMLSHPIEMDPLRARHEMSNQLNFAKFLSQIYFEIGYAANDIRFQMIPTRGMTFASSFEAIDPHPQERTQEASIRDFKWFKVSNPNIQDLIVHPDQVPELLSLVLKTQSEQQKDIRQKNKSRANHEAYRSGEMFETKPAHKIHAQIITLAG